MQLIQQYDYIFIELITKDITAS